MGEQLTDVERLKSQEIGARMAALVERFALPLDRPEFYPDYTKLYGQYPVTTDGPIQFDSVVFIRQEFPDPQDEERMSVAYEVGLAMGGSLPFFSMMYETHLHEIQGAGGTTFYDLAYDDFPSTRIPVADRLISWIEGKIEEGEIHLPDDSPTAPSKLGAPAVAATKMAM